jgi:phenylalanyl-tRNA synthetase beta chain
VALENPLSDAQSIMRPTLLGSLLDAARHNVARNDPDVAIFESGTVYRAHAAGHTSDLPADEHHALGVLLSGGLEPRAWRGEHREADFFAAKGLLGALLERFGLDWSVTAAAWPFLHPGRSAAVEVVAADGSALAGANGSEASVRLGFIGELHPLVASAWDLPRAAAFVIDLGKLAGITSPIVEFTAFGPFPPLRQDLAVILPEAVTAAEVLAAVRAAAGKTLEDVQVFDVYTGVQVGEGHRSLALALSFRVLDRTLTDEDIEPIRGKIVAALTELGGELRG